MEKKNRWDREGTEEVEEKKKWGGEVTHQLAEIYTAMDTVVLMRGSQWVTQAQIKELFDGLLIFSPVNINQGETLGTTDDP